jgi:predicted phosphodiesterase
MRIFALSDVHVDYEANADWIANISTSDHLEDLLILAGDVTDSLKLLDWCLSELTRRFRKVQFVPGNHDLWVARDDHRKTSFEKFAEVTAVVKSSGASMEVLRDGNLVIVPLLGWYDYSFGKPSEELKGIWMDYYACRWPAGFGNKEVADHFLAMNVLPAVSTCDVVISFSHFLPRIDVMPSSMPQNSRELYPVLGSTQIERQIRRIKSSMHVYGHSHINRRIQLDGITYINNAFGYPHESWIVAKRLLCIYDC